MLHELIDKPLSYCWPSTPLNEVARSLRDDRVDAVLVVEAGIPRGFVTDRDLAVRCVAESLDPRNTPAEAIMDRRVVTAIASEDVYDVALRMREAHVRRLALVDDSGNAIGLVTFDDVFDLLSRELDHLREALRTSAESAKETGSAPSGPRLATSG